MTPSKVTGFYDFRITAEKAMDYFLHINFKPADVIITRFDASLVDPIKKVNDGTKINDHNIKSFFEHIFSAAGNQADSEEPATDRQGFLITITTNSPESTELVKDALQHHGAKFIHEH